MVPTSCKNHTPVYSLQAFIATGIMGDIALVSIVEGSVVAASDHQASVSCSHRSRPDGP